MKQFKSHYRNSSIFQMGELFSTCFSIEELILSKAQIHFRQLSLVMTYDSSRLFISSNYSPWKQFTHNKLANWLNIKIKQISARDNFDESLKFGTQFYVSITFFEHHDEIECNTVFILNSSIGFRMWTGTLRYSIWDWFLFTSKSVVECAYVHKKNVYFG